MAEVPEREAPRSSGSRSSSGGEPYYSRLISPWVAMNAGDGDRRVVRATLLERHAIRTKRSAANDAG